MPASQSEFFKTNLQIWNNTINNRKMPWKGEKNPYYIWLSEIILQQTRVEQGWDYYLKFINLFPTVEDLANAKQDDVLKAWEGLGYYSRARNLHYAAQQIVNQFGGDFPASKEALLTLKGVGDYTASAIASFAFNLPHAVVDGNVIRILSRFFGIDTPFDIAKGKKIFADFALKCLDINNPALHNQAIMDFGALVCTPKNPSCSNCILNEKCTGYQNNLTDTLPVKSKKIIKKNRNFLFLDIEYNGARYIEQRLENDIWKNLYQFPLIEEKFSNNEMMESLIQQKIGTSDFTVVEKYSGFRQTLTHQKIEASFVKLIVNKSLKSNFIEVKPDNLYKFAFPKLINLYIKK